MRKWNILASLDAAPVPSSDGRHPVVRALLEQRGLVGVDVIDRFFFPDYERDIHDPFLFVSMRRVVDRIGEAIHRGERVGVFGDYDADGVTSSVILRTALEHLGLRISVYIPHKLDEGHGLHLNAIDAFERDGVTLAFTVDCGMTNHEELSEAKRRGIDFIVIDHHHVPEVLPDVYAIVNPKLPDAGYPFTELCGAGTVFKVAHALYQTFTPGDMGQLKWLLDIVAIGTVADVMPLVGENRTLVSFGLIVLGKTRRIGLQEMYAVGRLPIDDNRQPTAWTIGFQIAPRINAASRMAHAMQAHELLMATDRTAARDLAQEIEANNVARQKVSTSITERVRKIAAENRYSKLVFAADEGFAFGVVGLVAGRIANEFGKPTVVLERQETTSRGSLRSVPKLHITEALEECADLLVKFGGHAGAAGLTIENRHIDAFSERLNAVIERRLDGIATRAEQRIDLRISPHLINTGLLSEIRRFAPFGQANTEPVFLVEEMFLEEARTVGADNKHLKLVLRPDDASAIRFDAIAFGLGEQFPDLSRGTRLDIVFQLDDNTWNGTTTLQLKVLDMRECTGRML